MPFDIGGFGQSLATQASGAIFGLALEGHNDRRQLRQQEKLQNLQIKGQKEMSDYQYQKQLEMWNATNYRAQMRQLEMAGLNPALIYGMSGGGGTTTGNASGSVSGAQAPSGGGEIMGLSLQAMQLRMQEAQIKLAESQANKNNVEAEKTAGVDTAEAQTRIESLTQGINNQKAVETLTRVETEIKRTDLGFNKATYNDRVDYITQQARQMTGLASQALIQANLDTNARETRLNTIKAEYIQRLLENALITAKTNSEYQSISESQSNIRVNDARINQIAQGILQDWDNLELERRNTRLKESLGQFQTDPTNEILRGLSNGISTIIMVSGNNIKK